MCLLDLDGKGLEVLIISSVGVDRLPDHAGSVVAELLAPFLVLSLDGGNLLQQGEQMISQPLFFVGRRGR